MDVTATRRATLGRQVTAMRSRMPGGTRAAFAATTGLARNTMQKLEEGGEVRPHVWARVEEALGWPVGSALAYLDGAANLPGVVHVYATDYHLESYLVSRGAITAEQKLLVLARAQAEIVMAEQQSTVTAGTNE